MTRPKVKQHAFIGKDAYQAQREARRRRCCAP
jgi:hypothetical protein